MSTTPAPLLGFFLSLAQDCDDWHRAPAGDRRVQARRDVIQSARSLFYAALDGGAPPKLDELADALQGMPKCVEFCPVPKREGNR